MSSDNLGGADQTIDPTLIEMLQSPPQSPMSGTLIAPLALLYNFFGLKVKGNAAAAVQHLSKLFRLSSMPRQYIALLMAEMLPIFDGPPPYQMRLTTRSTDKVYWTKRSV